MHLYDTLKGDSARQCCDQILKLDPTKWDLNSVDRIEIYGTDLADDGPDYCEYRVIDNNNKVMTVKRELGY